MYVISWDSHSEGNRPLLSTTFSSALALHACLQPPALPLILPFSKQSPHWSCYSSCKGRNHLRLLFPQLIMLRASHTDSFCKIYTKSDPLIRGSCPHLCCSHHCPRLPSAAAITVHTSPFLLSLPGSLVLKLRLLLVLPCLSLPCLSAKSQSQLVKNKSDGITLYWKSFNGFSSYFLWTLRHALHQVALWPNLLPSQSPPCPLLGFGSSYSEEWKNSRAEFPRKTIDHWCSWADTWTLPWINILQTASGVCSVGWVCPPRFCVHLEP